MLAQRENWEVEGLTSPHDLLRFAAHSYGMDAPTPLEARTEQSAVERMVGYRNCAAQLRAIASQAPEASKAVLVRQAEEFERMAQEAEKEARASTSPSG